MSNTPANVHLQEVINGAVDIRPSNAAMRRVRAKNTQPELRVRRLLHGLGYRYRLHRRDLPGTPDIVFPGRRKVIFVHGCFWHGHSCPNGERTPRSNQRYWDPKLARNRTRDAEAQCDLQRLGWSVLIVWECEIPDLETNPDRLIAFLDGANGETLSQERRAASTTDR